MGGNRPDGGVDLVLKKGGRRYLVQCKHWKTWQVGVAVVRELNGVIAEQRQMADMSSQAATSRGTPKYLPVVAALRSSMASRWSRCSSRLPTRPPGRSIKPRTGRQRARAVRYAARQWNKSSLNRGSSKASRSGNRLYKDLELITFLRFRVIGRHSMGSATASLNHRLNTVSSGASGEWTHHPVDCGERSFPFNPFGLGRGERYAASKESKHGAGLAFYYGIRRAGDA